MAQVFYGGVIGSSCDIGVAMCVKGVRICTDLAVQAGDFCTGVEVEMIKQLGHFLFETRSIGALIQAVSLRFPRPFPIMIDNNQQE